MKMKKLLTMIAALLMTLTASAQFEQDKVYIGGSLTGLFRSTKLIRKFLLGWIFHKT